MRTMPKKGKNFKLVFKTTNVRDYDATALTCANGNVGLTVQAQKITLTSQQNRIELPICEDDFLEFEFNILPDSKYKEMVLWCDGIPCKVELYDASDNFTQASPVGITIGSADCDVQVYRMKTYGMELTDDEILDNFIADAKNAELMIIGHAARMFSMQITFCRLRQTVRFTAMLPRMSSMACA